MFLYIMYAFWIITIVNVGFFSILSTIQSNNEKIEFVLNNIKLKNTLIYYKKVNKYIIYVLNNSK